MANEIVSMGLNQADIQPMSAVQVRAQVNLIQQVMSAVMQKGQHYGTVPGCGDKPTLLKPGAEKLMMTFRLAADPQVEEIPTNDGLTYRVTCRIINQATGVFLGAGVGEASTKEEKYNWRKVVCDGEFNDTPEDKKRLKWAKGYQNKPDYQIKQVRTNPADIANTVLKMAKKRALVDAILTVTAASDIFTQDIEDMSAEVLGNKGGNGEAGRPKTSTVKSTAPKDPGKPISEGQKKLIFAKGKAKGVKEEDIKTAFCVESIADLTMGQMNDVIAFIEKGVMPEGGSDGLPEGCTEDPNTCPHSLFDEDAKALCGDKPCQFYATGDNF